MHSASNFRKNLYQAIKSGLISKMELSRRSDIARNSIDGYLNGSVPNLNHLDAIARALNTRGADLIASPNAPMDMDPHDIRDCAKAVYEYFDEV